MMKIIVFTFFFLFQSSLYAITPTDSTEVILIYSPTLVNKTGQECQTCTVQLNDSDNYVLKKIYFESGTETLRIEYEYYTQYPGRLFTISVFKENHLIELKDKIDETDTCNFYQKYYFENGKVALEGSIKSGKQNGVWNYYYQTGKIKQTIKFIDGIKNGKYKSYSLNGKLISDGAYIDNLMDGKWTEYDSTGSSIEQIEYRKGEKISTVSKLNREERILKTMSELKITDSDLKGKIQFFNIEKQNTIRHFIQLFDKYRTAIGKVFHHELVVYHFMAHINRRFKALKADIDDFDGSIDPSTKTTGIGE